MHMPFFFICDSLPQVSLAVVLLAEEVQNCMEYNVGCCINSLFPIKIQTSQSEKTGVNAYFSYSSSDGRLVFFHTSKPFF